MIRSLLSFVLILFAASQWAAAQPADSEEHILSAYVKVSTALAGDDLAAAQSAAGQVANRAREAGRQTMAASAAELAASGDLPGARAVFRKLSADVVPLAGGREDFIVMTCPMAGADWVQESTAVRNPYYGKAMLTCGAPKEGRQASDPD